MTISKKLILIPLVIIAGGFTVSTLKYQQQINIGSAIADEQCIKVNPLIIARKNSYLNSMKIIQAKGSEDDYWAEMAKYLDYSKKYIEAENAWLKSQKAYMDSWDFNTFSPNYIKQAGQAQYDSREAEVKATVATVELFETYKDLDQEKQKAISNTIIDESKKSGEADDRYNKFFDNPPKLDFRERFVSVPKSKCPQENFDIPDVKDGLQNLFGPSPVPVTGGQPVS